MHTGLILTSARDLDRLGQHVAAMRADVLKIVTSWGLPWDDTSRRAALRLAPATIVRTVAGDPSYGRHTDRPWGVQPYPEAAAVVAEVRPWYEARDPAREFWIEIGNEPLLDPLPGHTRASETFAWLYRWHLAEAIAACRTQFPAAKIIAPAHIQNHPIPCGPHANGQAWMTTICAEVYRQCDALGLHAYSAAQLGAGVAQLRALVSRTLPIWLTEFALNEPMTDALRGAMYAATLRAAPLAGATLYHLDERGGTDPAHFHAHYRLSTTTLEAFAHAWRVAPAPALPPAPPKPAPPKPPAPAPAPAKAFAVDIRHWPTVEAFAAHLAAHSPSVCSWVEGITLHHTISPTLASWRGRRSVENLRDYYRDEAPWTDAQGRKRKGWPAGPQAFFAPDGIWQLTPLNMRGCHAVRFNATHWGWEVVGQYDDAPWSPAMRELVEGALAFSLRWLGKPVSVINGHRDDPTTTKSCPGRAIDLAAVRANVARRLLEPR